MSLHITFNPPLSGLAPLTEYDLVPLDGARGVYSLRSAERPEIRLFVVDANIYAPEFRAQLDSAPETATVLLVVTPRSDGHTVNLLAPIIVNLGAGTGQQVIQDADISRVRTPLAQAA